MRPVCRLQRKRETLSTTTTTETTLVRDVPRQTYTKSMPAANRHSRGHKVDRANNLDAFVQTTTAPTGRLSTTRRTAGPRKPRVTTECEVSAVLRPLVSNWHRAGLVMRRLLQATIQHVTRPERSDASESPPDVRRLTRRTPPPERTACRSSTRLVFHRTRAESLG